MSDSNGRGRLGRRTSSNCASPVSSDRSEGGTRQRSPCTPTGIRIPISDALDNACAADGPAEPPKGASADDVTSLSRQAHVDTDRGRVKEMPRRVVWASRACLALGAYVTLSILTVFWTKHLVAGKVPTPLFLSWVQQAVGLVLYSAVSAVVASVCGHGSAVGMALSVAVPVVRVRAPVMLRVLPLSFCFVGMIGSANLCLQRVQVSVYQVARSLTLVFSLFLSAFWLKQKVMRSEVCSCLLVALGFALMTAIGSDAASVGGYIMGALASLFQATYAVQMKATLNSIQKEADTLVPLSKTRSAYQLISGEASDAISGSSNANTEERSRTNTINGGVDADTQCIAVVVEPPLDASTFADGVWRGDGLLPEEGAVEAQDMLANDRGNRHKTKQNPRASGTGDSSPTAACIELEARNIAVELEDNNSGGSGDGDSSSSGDSGPPRAEPLCMFYNMLNALCLFPIVIAISDEPQTLWKLAAGGSVNTLVVLQVIGLGASHADF